MAEPTYIYKWAVQETDQDGNLTRTPPPPEVELTGTLIRQPIFRLWLNEMQYNFSSWIQFLVAKDVVGTVRSVETGTFASATVASTQYGGTWVEVGTDTLGTLAVTVYKKTVL